MTSSGRITYHCVSLFCRAAVNLANKFESDTEWSLSDEEPISHLSANHQRKKAENSAIEYQQHMNRFWSRVEPLKDNIAERERKKQQIAYLEYKKGGKMVATRPTNTGSAWKRHGEAPKKHYLKSRVDLMNVADAGKMPAQKIVARKARASTKNPLPKVKPATKNKHVMKNKAGTKNTVPKKTPATKKSVAAKEPATKKPAPKAKRATKQYVAKTKNRAVWSTKKLAKAARATAKEVVDVDAVDTPTHPKQVVARSSPTRCRNSPPQEPSSLPSWPALPLVCRLQTWNSLLLAH
jgi:hypothetical protein